MKINGESIYGSVASPFPNLPWGRCTQKVGRYGPFGLLGKTTTLYLHVFDWPADGKLVVPDLKNPIFNAEMLDGGAKLDATLTDAGAVIRVPAKAPDANASVVVLRVRGEVETQPFVVKQEADGKIDLRPDAAEMTGRLQAHGFIHVNFQRWTDPADVAEWTVQVDKAGTYDLAFQAGAVSPAKIVLVAGGKRHEFAVAATGDVRKYKPVKSAPVDLNAGRQTIRLEAVAEGWNPVNVRTLTLTPK
jgi:alpha-L-fucosidase